MPGVDLEYVRDEALDGKLARATPWSFPQTRIGLNILTCDRDARDGSRGVKHPGQSGRLFPRTLEQGNEPSWSQSSTAVQNVDHCGFQATVIYLGRLAEDGWVDEHWNVALRRR